MLPFIDFGTLTDKFENMDNNPIDNLANNPDDKSIIDNVMDALGNSDVPLVNIESRKGKEIEGSNDKGQDEQV